MAIISTDNSGGIYWNDTATCCRRAEVGKVLLACQRAGIIKVTFIAERALLCG